MPEESAHLPLTITPEELERAEIAVLLDFLRENAAQHDVSVLREQALAVGYRASVVNQACADFDEELRDFVESEPEPAPVRTEERPRPAAVSPVPVPPPPKVPVFLQTLAAAEKEEGERQARSKRVTSAGLVLLILLLNAVFLIPAFAGNEGVSVLAYCAEIALALLLSGLQKIRTDRRQEQLAGETLASTAPIASAVRAEPERSPVPARPHEVRTEAPETPRVSQRTP